MELHNSSKLKKKTKNIWVIMGNYKSKGFASILWLNDHTNEYESPIYSFDAKKLHKDWMKIEKMKKNMTLVYKRKEKKST